MLSNLYIIEWIFNTGGIFMFLKSYEGIRVEVFIVSVLLIYIPILFYLNFSLSHSGCDEGEIIICGRI